MSGIDSLLQQVAALADEVPAPDVSALRQAGDRRRRRARVSAGAAVAAGVVAVLVAVSVVTDGGADRAVPPPPVAPVQELVGSVLVPDANGNVVAVSPAGQTHEVVSAPDGDAITNIIVDATGARLLVVPGDIALGSQPPQPAPWLWLADADGSHVRKLARCPGDCSWAYQPTYRWSPNGDRVLVANPQGLYIVSVPDGDVSTLDVGTGSVSGAAWSPDGSRVAAGVGTEVRSVALDGTGLRTLATGLEPGRIDWSPDGTRLAVSGASDGVWVVDATGTAGAAGTVKVAEQLQGEGPGVASWSPDGRRLAYFTTPREKAGTHRFVPEVHTVAPDGTDDRRLYRGPCCVSGWGAPAWSPDGSTIAVMVDTEDPATGVHGLVTIDVANGRSNVFPVRYAMGDPVWYPGG